MLTQLQPPAYGTLGPKGLLEFLGNSSRFLSSAPPPHTKLMIGNRSTSLLTINPESANPGIMTGSQSGFGIVFGQAAILATGRCHRIGRKVTHAPWAMTKVAFLWLSPDAWSECLNKGEISAVPDVIVCGHCLRSLSAVIVCSHCLGRVSECICDVSASAFWADELPWGKLA